MMITDRNRKAWAPSDICGYGAGEEMVTWSYVLPGVVAVAVDSRGHPTAVLENQVPLSRV